MTPDQIAGSQKTSVALSTRLLHDDTNSHAPVTLVSGTRRALRFIAHLLHSLADAPALPADFSFSPDGAGKFHFDDASSLGLYLECTPAGEGAEDADASREMVWIFHGDSGRHASAVFRTEGDARAWIERHGVAGLLTEYPVGDGCYDIAVRQGSFRPSRAHHGSADHVAGFSPGWTRHHHFEHQESENG